MKSWGHGNKAFRIIATLPLFALATQLAFRRRKYKLNYNTTEHVFIQAYIACQILLLSIIVLPFNGYAKVDDLYELPLWLIFVLFCWNYKQLYRCTWWRSFWRTILMLTYSLVLLVIFACLVMALMLAGIYVLKFICNRNHPYTDCFSLMKQFFSNNLKVQSALKEQKSKRTFVHLE